MAIKVIMLDVDGVLNSGEYIHRLDGAFDDPKNQMDPQAVSLFNKITDATGAKVVISSTWRLAFFKSAYPLRQLQCCMESYKLTGEVIDYTPQLNSRGQEIQAWLQYRRDIEKFIIIDDDSDMGDLMPHLIKTQFEYGLRQEHVDLATNILGEL